MTDIKVGDKIFLRQPAGDFSSTGSDFDAGTVFSLREDFVETVVVSVDADGVTTGAYVWDSSFTVDEFSFSEVYKKRRRLVRRLYTWRINYSFFLRKTCSGLKKNNVMGGFKKLSAPIPKFIILK